MTGAAAPTGGESEAAYFYRLDAEDRIIEIGGVPMGAEVDKDGSMHPDRLVGSPLFDHVSGHFTRQFLRLFLTSARNAGVQRRRLYRCDTPGERQLMEMVATPLERGEVLIAHRLVSAEAFAYPVKIRPSAGRRAASVLRCSMCNRLQQRSSGRWVEPDSIAQPKGETLVIHTACPDCRHGRRRSALGRP
jgi:uncharacterized protein YbaR (Trm112 family)